MHGATVYDKIIGRAAATLLVHAKVKEVWTPTISREGKRYLAKNGVKLTYKKVIAGVKNREGDGPCPMEKMSLRMTEKDFVEKMLG